MEPYVSFAGVLGTAGIVVFSFVVQMQVCVCVCAFAEVNQLLVDGKTLCSFLCVHTD
eukprot:COSAG03_NODE_3787_length_1830_cov_2.860774_2_plen_57_part_00